MRHAYAPVAPCAAIRLVHTGGLWGKFPATGSNVLPRLKVVNDTQA